MNLARGELRRIYRPAYQNVVSSNSGFTATSSGRVFACTRTGRFIERCEKLWREFFANTSYWWDNRTGKPNARFPDFKHKQSGEDLWLNGDQNPAWVESIIAAIGPGVSVFSLSQRPSIDKNSGLYEKTVDYVDHGPEEGFNSGRNRSRIKVPGVNEKQEKLWRDLLADPSKWWDNRFGKPNERFPDFKHKQTKEGLWLNHRGNPSWVASEVASIAPGVPIFALAQSLSRYNKAGQYGKTIEHFHEVQREGSIVDEYVFVHVLNACAALEALQEGRLIHEQITETGCESNNFVANSLVDMYAKCGSIKDAQSVFDRMSRRDVVAWTSMILGCVKCGKGQEGLELFSQMKLEGIMPDSTCFVALLNACASSVSLEEGRRVHEQLLLSGLESNPYVVSSLVDMYAKCGSIEDAQIVFERVSSRNVVSYNAMIQGLVKYGLGLEALELFQGMQLDGVEPDSVTFVSVLNACASVAALEQGRLIHGLIIRIGCESNAYIGSSLLDMYSKCGSIEDAKSVFEKLPKRDVVSWTAMILGFAMHGYSKEAVALFEQMSQSGCEMNEVTFSCLLLACSHGGLVKEGLQYFERMQSVHGVSPNQDHYACMVDILGRAGRLGDAEALIMGMPLESTPAVWMSLLSACRIHGNLEMGERAAQHILNLDPENSAGYVQLSNIYAAAGQFDRQKITHRHRLENKAWKSPGRTWIEIAGRFHTFLANDRRHPQIKEILAELEKLSNEMAEAGYLPDTKFALQNDSEEWKVSHFCGHSEKLAVGLGLISTPAGAPFRIVKNLRVCGDCHVATKFIAKIAGREITVRDANRFHVFKDGYCSCGDYW